ncbi:type II toxin-antitoxin system RelE/ParE family toxin [Aquimarina sp. I32.4]|uniref:type II toxin-antitoxin system RelE/ParE family toxin n=1 Tax=Aquimarina sp. I32.4 TaxID=2053903 RepID=UPI000CDED2BC|nr:type II toxin-antitoxin system RelE/ParE family toxin [Aquimarina sp. I32.4]
MALKIVWTDKALEGLDEIIAYLETHWSEKEILLLEQKIEAFKARVKKYPKIYPPITKHKNTHKAVLDKHNYFVYRYKPRKQVIELVYFKANKQKPIV